MSVDHGSHAIVRLDADLYTLSVFFGILVPDCKPALDSPPPISSPEHEADWKNSAINETEYDCAKLAGISVDHGDQDFVIGATDVRYTVSEVFASLAPDCVPSGEKRDLLSRIGSDAGWVEGTNADYEYYCDFISVALAEFGEIDFIRYKGKVLTFNDYHLQAVPLCNLRADPPSKTMQAPLHNVWVQYGSSSDAFNCPAVRLLLSEYGIQDNLRSGSNTWTSLSYFQSNIPGCVSTNAITRRIAALRECAATSCRSIQRVRGGAVLEVVGINEPWYEVAVGDEIAFVTGLNTRLGGNPVLEPLDGHYFDAFACVASVSYKRGSGVDIDIVELFERPNISEVELYRPLEEMGIYVFEVTVGDAVERIGLDASIEGKYEFLMGGC